MSSSMFQQRSLQILVSLCLGAGMLGVAQAQESAATVAPELSAGFVITANNLDRAKSSTFHGREVGAMLTDRIEWQIRNYGQTIRLKDPEPHPVDPRLARATELYRGTTTFDPSTRMVHGYKSGVPFPEIDYANDPHAGAKAIWNFTYAQPRLDIQDFRRFAYLLIDGNAGIERTLQGGYVRYYMKGQVRDIENPVEGEGELDKLLLWFYYPQDVRGVGTFTIRYDTGKLPDVWAYIRTVRRVRRLSGGAWMDPVGGTDQLQDDLDIFNAHPAWYDSYQLIGKATFLAIVNSDGMAWNEDAGSIDRTYPHVDLKTLPYWNPVDVWEPRELLVIEAVPPHYHPYSKKIVYLDAENYRPVFGDHYDRKGVYWKHQNFAGRVLKAEDGGVGVTSNWGSTIDFQRDHATIFKSHPSWAFNPQGIEAEDVSLQRLEDAARGGGFN
ncbi:MAG: DUF1329 domain-containing protein [Alphaproteobacteria bacterium]